MVGGCNIPKAGPGPGAYMLPSTVGYNKHDPSRYRNPMFSMQGKHPHIGKSVGPGPAYDLNKMTRYGKEQKPAYSLRSRRKELVSGQTPGPGTYSLDKRICNKTPGFTMHIRPHMLVGGQTPGPNQYMQPSTLGPKVPNKPASQAYSMSGKHDIKGTQRSPGPAGYSGVPTDIYRFKPPKYTMSNRHPGVGMRGLNPGPAGYYPKLPKEGLGGFSFGLKHCLPPYITADDDMPCVERPNQ